MSMHPLKELTWNTVGAMPSQQLSQQAHTLSLFQSAQNSWHIAILLLYRVIESVCMAMTNIVYNYYVTM